MKNKNEILTNIADNVRVITELTKTNNTVRFNDRSLICSNKTKIKRLNKLNKELKLIVKYLETEPSEQYLNAEKQRLIKLIDAKESGFTKWCIYALEAKQLEEKKRLPYYEKLFNLKQLRIQLKTINFILK